MGRWAQARRRGGGPPGPAAPSSLPTLLTAVDLEGGSLRLTFSAAITVNPAAVPDNGPLLLDGGAVNVAAAASGGAAVVIISQDIDPSAGTTVTWASQPPWITTPIDLASSTLVT